MLKVLDIFKYVHVRSLFHTFCTIKVGLYYQRNGFFSFYNYTNNNEGADSINAEW